MNLSRHLLHIAIAYHGAFRFNLKQLALLGVLLLIFTPIVPTKVYGQAASPDLPSVEAAARQAGVDQLTEKQARGEAISQPAENILITQTQISENYAFGFIVYQALSDDHGMPEALLYIGHWNGSQWDIAVEYTSEFYERLNMLPATLITEEARAALLSSMSSDRAPDASLGLRLPWPTGETWNMTGGPHHRTSGLYPNNPRPWGAIDFNGTSGSIRAARDGTAWAPCANFIRIDHANGIQTTYYHVRDVAVVNGQSVKWGHHLGWTSTQAGCGGYATGPHVHFAPLINGNDIDLHEKIIGGWMILYGPDGYHGCMERLWDKKRYCYPSPVPVINYGISGRGYDIGQNAGKSWDAGNSANWAKSFKSAFSRSTKKGPAVTDASAGVQLFLTDNLTRAGLVANVGAEQVFYVGSGLMDWIQKYGYPTKRIVKNDEKWYSKDGTEIIGPPTTDEVKADGKTLVCFANGCLNYNNGKPVMEYWPAPNPDQWRVTFRNWHKFSGGISYTTNVNLPNNGFSLSWDGQPNPRVLKDGFTTELTKVLSFQAGVYQFRVRADDRVEIFIRYNDVGPEHLIVTASTGQPTQYKNFEIPAGNHRILIRHKEATSIAFIEVGWRFEYRQLTVKNNGFEETGNSGKEARYWKHPDLSGGKRVTNKPNKGKYFSHTGSAALMLKSGGKVSQKIEPPTCQLGQTIRVSAFVKGNNLKAGAMFKVKYTYLNGTKDSLVVPIPTGTYDYTEISGPKLLGGNLKKLKLNAIGGNGGKAYVDDVRVVCRAPNTREEIPHIVLDETEVVEETFLELPSDLDTISAGELIDLPIAP